MLHKLKDIDYVICTQMWAKYILTFLNEPKIGVSCNAGKESFKDLAEFRVESE